MPILNEPINLGPRFQVAGHNGLTIIDATTAEHLTQALKQLDMPADLATIMARLLVGGEPIVALAGWEAKCLGTVMLHPLPHTAVFTSKPASTGGRRSRKARTAQQKVQLQAEVGRVGRKPEKRKAAVAPDDTSRTDEQDTPLFGALDNPDQS
ncbi:hypothetical protein [Deinococcus altitudinis]|uniref:hypothetical protein n=1 Tax=Deinococcus altitudinis TaxID=468914 RepID=UPI00389183D2